MKFFLAPTGADAMAAPRADEDPSQFLRGWCATGQKTV
jgi:hypothetical protein